LDTVLDLPRKSKMILKKNSDVSFTDFCNNVVVSDLIILAISRTSFNIVPSTCCPVPIGFGLLIFA